MPLITALYGLLTRLGRRGQQDRNPEECCVTATRDAYFKKGGLVSNISTPQKLTRTWREKLAFDYQTRVQCGDTNLAGCRVREDWTVVGSDGHWTESYSRLSGSGSGKMGWSLEGNESSKDRFLFDI